MLTEPELKTVVDTLMQQRAALEAQISGDNASAATLETTKASIELLDSAIKKITESGAEAANENPNNTSSKGGPAPAVTTHDKTQPDLSFLKVLVAEDDSYSIKLLQSVLEDLNINKIDTAKDGTEALKLIFQTEKAYDIVLCDWNMPGKSGIEVHSIMRTDSRFKKTVFIIVSAVSESDQIRTAIQQGVNDYVVKPIDQEILTKKIIRASEKVKTLRNL